jgi:hypothetical protein
MLPEFATRVRATEVHGFAGSLDRNGRFRFAVVNQIRESKSPSRVGRMNLGLT